MWRKTGTGLAVTLLVAFLAVGVWIGNRADVDTGSHDTLRIGAILPLTGDAGVYGKALQRGMDLACSEVNESSKTKRKISLLYEDDAGNAGTAVSAARKLIDADGVRYMIGGAMSSTAAPIIPITERAGILLISPTATSASLTNNTRLFFRLWPSDDYDGGFMAAVASEQLGIKTAAIFYINTAYGKGIAEAFRDKFKELGGEIVYDEGYAQGATDFRTSIEKMRQRHPEAVYLPDMPKKLAFS